MWIIAGPQLSDLPSTGKTLTLDRKSRGSPTAEVKIFYKRGHEFETLQRRASTDEAIRLQDESAQRQDLKNDDLIQNEFANQNEDELFVADKHLTWAQKVKKINNDESIT